jgi:hypothetical protein
MEDAAASSFSRRGCADDVKRNGNEEQKLQHGRIRSECGQRDHVEGDALSPHLIGSAPPSMTESGGSLHPGAPLVEHAADWKRGCCAASSTRMHKSGIRLHDDPHARACLRSAGW